jgi:hypothetical protein
MCKSQLKLRIDIKTPKEVFDQMTREAMNGALRM